MTSAVGVLLLIFCVWTKLCLAASNDSAPGALVIPPSEYFEGNDGPWSSFHLRVGTPEQSVRVLVSTASPQTMVVLSDDGCATSSFSGSSAPPNCAVSRGSLFNPNQSSTWNKVGRYSINGDGVGLEANLGYHADVTFALETMAVGLNGRRYENQTVAGLSASEPFYLGVFGLNNQPVNFSSLGNYSASSYLTTLKEEGVIPSLSWSYTAGAQYRLKQVYGQLIFSGYDKSRIDTQSTVSFTMADDQTRDLVVALQSISYSGSNEATLLSDTIPIMIDSTDPNLWLPDKACDAFEKAFDLTLDQKSGLYLVNDTHHTLLLKSDARVSFRLSDVKKGGDAVTVTLPYEAFALQAQAPLVNETSYYFPLKRAANATQYTLGRVFLQEAYLSADYERHVFNISACTWQQGAVADIVVITSKDDPGSTSGDGPPSTTSSGSSGSSGLSPGAIAGIVIGCVVFIVLVVVIIALLVRRRNLVVTYTAQQPVSDQTVESGPIFNFGSSHAGSSVPTGSPAAPTVSENMAERRSSVTNELGTTEVTPNSEPKGDAPVHELHGESSTHNSMMTPFPVHEMLGSVPSKRISSRQARTGPGPSLLRDSSQEDGSNESPSPMVSTVRSHGSSESLRDRDNGSHLVSPTTPVHSYSRPW